MTCQFFVHLPPPAHPFASPRLSCFVYQRSAEAGLGIPFNIASYALLVHMVAHVTGVEPFELIIQFGDTYVHRDHFGALRTQLEREPRPFPKLRWPRMVNSIDDFTSEDFVVEGYNPHPNI